MPPGRGSRDRPLPVLTLGGQVEADMPIIMHGAVELAVTDLAEVEGAPVVQLLAVGVVAYLCGKGWGRGGPKALWYTGPLAALHVQPSVFQRGLCLLIYSSNVSQAPTRCPFWGMQRQQSPARKKQRQVTMKQVLPGPLPEHRQQGPQKVKLGLPVTWPNSVSSNRMPPRPPCPEPLPSIL